MLVGYAELLRPSAFGFAKDTNLGLNNSSYPTPLHSIIVYYWYYEDLGLRVESFAIIKLRARGVIYNLYK